MGRVQIFTGDGYGKTMAALGEALIAAASGKQENGQHSQQKRRDQARAESVLSHGTALQIQNFVPL